MLCPQEQIPLLNFLVPVLGCFALYTCGTCRKNFFPPYTLKLKDVAKNDSPEKISHSTVRLLWCGRLVHLKYIFRAFFYHPLFPITIRVGIRKRDKMPLNVFRSRWDDSPGAGMECVFRKKLFHWTGKMRLKLESRFSPHTWAKEVSWSLGRPSRTVINISLIVLLDNFSVFPVFFVALLVACVCPDAGAFLFGKQSG